ncbi:8-amino-7-oxononanoate synthase [Actinocrinis puniceicyclus]|uniref:8-amino-7-oxononanoate synthase n=1 Tax=Actinocrinis puniceicyclus TaxID=977794 RepID=A0A8J7WP33_9ACTN|nr:8-amino-7-oxononanoate synthase [Actinocrinis puniceicyclus]MBS2966031.1 8-amino-7-oxononanoate synthase [Actinocrinis puniceicyclus]
MTNPLGWLDEHARKREAAGLRRRLRPRPQHTGLVDLAGNDYLGLARDPRVTEAAARAAREWGGGSTGSRLVTGTTQAHVAFERELAAFVGAEAGLVFSSGYLANLGAITALAGRGDLIVSDALNHASLIDGCRLSRARVEVVGHGAVAEVRAALAERSEERAYVVTDAVFSVDGDVAPLAELAAACCEYGAVLIVDEAHGVGVFGDGGRGAVHAAGLAGSPDVVVTATLSKSLGAQGGVVLGPSAVIAHLVDTARAFIFDTGLAPAAVGAAAEALRILRAEPQLAERVRVNARALHDLAQAAALTATTPVGTVTSVLIGDPDLAVELAGLCAELGVAVGCFRPPSVPDGRSRLRLTARADLTHAELDAAGRALHAVAGRIGSVSVPPATHNVVQTNRARGLDNRDWSSPQS